MGRSSNGRISVEGWEIGKSGRGVNKVEAYPSVFSTVSSAWDRSFN